MKSKLIFLIMLLSILGAVFITGCSNSNLYSGVNNEIQLQEVANSKDGVEDASFAQRYLAWCDIVKWYAPFIMIGSVCIGILLLVIFKKVKEIRKTAIFLFIVGIPLTTLIIVYALCYMYGKLF